MQSQGQAADMTYDRGQTWRPVDGGDGTGRAADGRRNAAPAAEPRRRPGLY